MKKLTIEEQESLKSFLKENHLSSESKLVRYTSKNYLEYSNGHWYLKAKKEPFEMVVDNYHGFSEVFIASEIGQGIAFLTTNEKEYESSNRICIEVNLNDVLIQGGLVYIVTSLPAYLKAFFCTLPEGKVKIAISE